jgi:hypothetical protein
MSDRLRLRSHVRNFLASKNGRFAKSYEPTALPVLMSGAVLGPDGAVAPCNRIVFGGIGFRPRLKNTLRNFLFFKDVLQPYTFNVRTVLRPPLLTRGRSQGNPRLAARQDEALILSRLAPPRLRKNIQSEC